MRSYNRSGPPRHLGAAPGFNEVRNFFDFRGVKIGGWVKQQEQQLRARDFFIALLDLQEILQVPPFVISLRGQLSLHYGTGGQPGVSAHYMPAARVLALAKNAGAGSLAHEWFHAFDHYIAEHIFTRETGGRFASIAWLTDFELRSHGLCQLLAHCYRLILLNEAGEGPSEFVERAIAHDRSEGGLYWSKPEELCARAFESFIEDAHISNQFLAYGTRRQERGFDPYPRGEQREQINRAFTDYFAALGRSLSASRAEPESAPHQS
jgi:hypothetical protein